MVIQSHGELKRCAEDNGTDWNQLRQFLKPALQQTTLRIVLEYYLYRRLCRVACCCWQQCAISGL